MKQILSILISCVLIYSCGTNDTTKTHEQRTDIFQKEKELTLTIPDSCDYQGLMDITETDSGLVLANYNPTHHVIDVYNLSRNTYLRKIELKKEGPGSVGSMCFSLKFINFDAIYVTDAFSNTVYHISATPDVIGKYAFNDFKNFVAKTSINFSGSSPIYYNYSTDIGFATVKTGTQTDFFTKKCCAKFSLTKNEFISYFGDYPDMYHIDTKKEYYIHRFEPYIEHIDSISVFSFPAYDKIRIYNNISGEMIAEADAKSLFVDKIYTTTPPMQTPEEKQKEYEITEPRYGQVLYDKYRNCYYRIVKHSQELYAPDGLLNTVLRCPWSIIVLNKNFEKIGEQKFEKGMYNSWLFYITKDGLLINTSQFVGEEPEGVITFDLFSVNI